MTRCENFMKDFEHMDDKGKELMKETFEYKRCELADAFSNLCFEFCYDIGFFKLIEKIPFLRIKEKYKYRYEERKKRSV